MSSSAKPKLVVMLSRFPFPLEKGDKLRAYYQIIQFSAVYDITLICISDRDVSENDQSELKKYCEAVHIFNLPKLKSLWGSFRALLGTKPLQVGYFFSSSIKKEVDTIIKTVKPNHIYCQLIRASEYVKDYHNCPKTIDYMDAFSTGIERRIELETFYKRWIFKLESKRLNRYEREIFDYFELHTIISEQDAAILGTTVNQKIECVPNGVAESFLNYNSNKPAEFDIVFVGNLNYPPNVQAVKFILDEILPSARKRGLDWSFVAAGADPSKDLAERFKKVPNTQLRSNISDIREGYCAGKVFVAPMKIGTGLQNKLLEAMALGLPSVTTKLANNALQAKVNEEILVAESSADFIGAIELLLEGEIDVSIGKSGKEYIAKNFDWSNSTKKLINNMLKA